MIKRVLFWFRILSDRRHYYTAFRLPFVYQRPVAFLKRYVFGKGDYPASVDVRVGGNKVRANVYSKADVDTVNQIFCRKDYPISPTAKVTVDIGSNIGLATTYFLTVAPQSVCYCFEPDPKNVARFGENTSNFESRIILSETAVSNFSGKANFHLESTGRTGSLMAVEGGDKIEVVVQDVNNVLSQVSDKHGMIDFLKVDIEGHEERVLRAIDADILCKIKVIAAEYSGPLTLNGFKKRAWGIVTIFEQDTRA